MDMPDYSRSRLNRQMHPAHTQEHLACILWMDEHRTMPTDVQDEQLRNLIRGGMHPAVAVGTLSAFIGQLYL